MPGKNPTADADCDDPVCSRKNEMFDAMRASMGGSASTTTEPLDVDELGRASWGLLHTIAAYYPDKPSAAQKVQARRFFDALGDLYPCSMCQKDLREDINANPPRVESREALSVWVCERHNEVNRKLNKPVKSCALKDLDERWRAKQ